MNLINLISVAFSQRYGNGEGKSPKQFRVPVFDWTTKSSSIHFPAILTSSWEQQHISHKTFVELLSTAEHKNASMYCYIFFIIQYWTFVWKYATKTQSTPTKLFMFTYYQQQEGWDGLAQVSFLFLFVQLTNSDELSSLPDGWSKRSTLLPKCSPQKIYRPFIPA